MYRYIIDVIYFLDELIIHVWSLSSFGIRNVDKIGNSVVVSKQLKYWYLLPD